MKLKSKFTSLAAGTTLLAGALLLPASGVRAADPYDKSLEKRVEMLERELNILQGDTKGKNVDSTEVPAFVRASSNVQELVFSGELRFRYEHSEVDGQAVNATAQADRLRYRFRLFADYKLNNNFFAGAAIQTSQGSDSGNSTFTEGFDNYPIFLWRFFLGWHSADDRLKIVAGKQAIPFYENTEMYWDGDISPTGLTETVKIPIGTQFELQLIGGQFTFYDNAENAFYNNPRTITTTDAAGVTTTVPNPAYVRGGDNNDDAYLLAQQVVGIYKPTNQLTITGAGGFQFYAGHGGTNAAGATNPAPTGAAPGGGTLLNAAAFNSANASRNLEIATGTGDVKLDLGALKVKVYGDLAYNFKGGARNGEEYGLPTLNDATDKLAFAAGVSIGSTFQIKKAGDYTLLAEYRQVGLGSIDPNLNDSDWNFSRLGFRGVKVSGAYAFQPWLFATVTYYNANNLGTEKNLNIGVGNYNASHIFQVDLTARF